MINFKHLHYFYTVAKVGSIVRAAEKLHLTPQTLSGQISQFEERLGVTLFLRQGRRLVLTETGHLTYSYADEIFQIGTELEESLKEGMQEKNYPLRVGISDVVPKSIAHRLLSPVLSAAQPMRLICREDRLERLLADLSIHRLDVVLADRPIPAGVDLKGISHPLGECAVAFFANPSLAATLTGEFPACLNGAPLLLPGDDGALRTPILRWLERHQVQPKIVGEFDDSALMKTFGQAGAGVFPALSVNGADVESQFGVVRIGDTTEIRERFFAITVARKISHPGVLAVMQAAEKGLFNDTPLS